MRGACDRKKREGSGVVRDLLNRALARRKGSSLPAHTTVCTIDIGYSRILGLGECKERRPWEMGTTSSINSGSASRDDFRICTV